MQSSHIDCHVAASINWGVPFVGVLILRALELGVDIKAPDFGKLPHYPPPQIYSKSPIRP